VRVNEQSAATYIARLASVLILSMLHADAAIAQGAQPPSGTGAATSPPGVWTIVSSVPEDAWRFFSLDTAVVLAAGGGAAGIAHIWDDDFADEIETNVRLNDAFSAGATYGVFPTQAAIGIGTYALGRAFSSRLAVAGADMIRAQVVSQIWVQTLKYSVGRERPDGSNNHSFPSGHAATSMATSAVLMRHYGWKVGVPAYAVAAYVAASRVHDNRHYLSDVVFGAAMGIASERTVTLHSTRYAVLLMPTGRRGASIQIRVMPRLQ
jgi:membrane-associated phospholipid phosphatase